jgi:ribosomal protein S28E/S33
MTQQQIELQLRVAKKKEKTVQEMVIHLLDKAGMRAQAISDAMDGRVSTRTIYRWAKGESLPQNTTDLAALQQLYRERT